jgi:hypothetical protein
MGNTILASFGKSLSGIDDREIYEWAEEGGNIR